VFQWLAFCCIYFGGGSSLQIWPNCESQFGHEIVQFATDLGDLYRIYSIPTHDKHQWLLLQFIVLLMMDARGI